MTKTKLNNNEKANETQLMEHIRNFSFPRLSGTDGEKKAINLTIQTFKNLGYKDQQINIQKFEFSTFYSEYLIKIIGIMNIIIVLTLLFIKYLYPFLVILTIIIISIIFLSMIRILTHPELKGFWEKYIGKFISSSNVYIKLNSNNNANKSKGNILISAHLDSKSQTFKTIWRVIFFSIWEFGIIIFVFLITSFLIDLYFNLFKTILIYLEISLIITSAIIVISILMILLIKTENESPGAIDNATGMSLVFELSSYFKMKPLNNFNIWFCQFSAEEIGTMGSRVFIDKYVDDFKQKELYQINFDMVSCKNHKKKVEFIKSYGIIRRKKTSDLLVSFIKDIGKENEIQIEGHTLLSGAHTDSVPFQLNDFTSINFATPSAAEYSHSREDTIDKVEPKVLYNTLILVINLICKLDQT